MVEVNKPTLLVVGIAVVALSAVAVLVGTALSQPNAPVGGGDGTPTVGAATDLPTLPPPNATATTEPQGAPTPTPTPYRTLTPPTPTGTPTPTVTEVPAYSFDEREIERLVVELINERREAENLTRLKPDGRSGEALTAMARDHSVAMADKGESIHRIDGVTSADRYRENDLYTRCQWSTPDGNQLVIPDDNALEAVEQTVAGKPYYIEGERLFHGSDRAVARHLVDTWWNSSTYYPRLSRIGADEVGVGIEITRRGTVFATVDLC